MPSRSVAEAAIEFFEALNTVPMAERAPSFGPPLFARLLPLLLAHARYPADFTSWVECLEDDADDFHRFRCGMDGACSFSLAECLLCWASTGWHPCDLPEHR